MATVWAAFSTIIIALVISTLYRRDTERGFNDLLHAQLYNVVNSISIDENGALDGAPQMGNLQFAQPDTGWYWIAEPVGNYKADRLASSSLGSAELPAADPADVPFDGWYERSYLTTDKAGNNVQVSEAEIQLDEDGHVVRFRVAGNRSAVEDSVGAFEQNLYLALFVFGIGGIVLNAGAIFFALKPLDRARRALERVRDAKAERLEGDFPREIQPLANEVNALIDNNRRIIERARMQVGNLAHSLKTPIAVLLNETRTMAPEHGKLVKTQADAMQNQVQAYLNRARISAQRGTVLARTEAGPVLARLVRVMAKLNRDTEFELRHVDGEIVLAMEAQDLEEIMGNLLENAARFARQRIILDMRRAPTPKEASGHANWVVITVEDDGPGLTAEQRKEAVKRGRRLDESRPGSGLGLSIVSEVVQEYQGFFSLDQSDMGGLRAELLLPAVASEAG